MQTPTDFETEYNNRARVPDHAKIIASWEEQSASWRNDAHKAELDLSYGDGTRHKLDIFSPEADKSGPIVMFIHGGYWQALGREWFSHMARGPNLNGLTMAIPSYDLCPNVTVLDIVKEMRKCCVWLWKRYQRRIVVSGHSAGGHLTACLLATDWPAFDRDAPAMLVGAGLAISGLFDLEPLVPTSINDNLNLSQPDARKASPIHWTAPSGLKMIAAVGGLESAEYLRQSKEIARVWHKQGLAIMPRVLAGENHFSIIASLAEEDGVLTKTLTGLASGAT
jgi:arylformamidase